MGEKECLPASSGPVHLLHLMTSIQFKHQAFGARRPTAKVTKERVLDDGVDNGFAHQLPRCFVKSIGVVYNGGKQT